MTGWSIRRKERPMAVIIQTADAAGERIDAFLARTVEDI